jgi:hypothetical protein
VDAGTVDLLARVGGVAVPTLVAITPLSGPARLRQRMKSEDWPTCPRASPRTPDEGACRGLRFTVG